MKLSHFVTIYFIWNYFHSDILIQGFWNEGQLIEVFIEFLATDVVPLYTLKLIKDKLNFS